MPSRTARSHEMPTTVAQPNRVDHIAAQRPETRVLTFLRSGGMTGLPHGSSEDGRYASRAPRRQVSRRNGSGAERRRRVGAWPATSGQGPSQTLNSTPERVVVGDFPPGRAENPDDALGPVQWPYWLCSQYPARSPHNDTDALWRARRGAFGLTDSSVGPAFCCPPGVPALS